MSQSEFEKCYSVKTNFLEYGRLKTRLKDFLMDKEMPRYEELNPQNNIVNMIISQDRKIYIKEYMVDLLTYYITSVQNGN